VFALIAFVVFLLWLLGAHLGGLNLLALGLALLALHFVWSPWTPPWGRG
jgi:hypothetical protein